MTFAEDKEAFEEDPKTFLESQGYFAVREIRGRGWCGLYRFLFTVGVCHGMDWSGLSGRFCFESLPSALNFYVNWDGITLPVLGENGCTAIK